MQINQSAMMMQNLGQINQTTSSLQKINERLATGKRVNSAADDSASLAIAKRFESMVRGMKQAETNVSDGSNAMQVADGAASEVTNMLQRQRELAIQAGNGTLNDADRKSLNQEYQQLNEEISRVAESTEFNSQNVTNGSSPLSDGSGAIQAGSQPGQQIQFPEFDISADSLGAGGDISSVDGAAAAIGTTDTALQNLSSKRSEIGAQMNSLEHTGNNLSNQSLQAAEAQSRVEDLDYAKALTEQARTGFLNQSATAMNKQFNDINRQNLLALMQ